MRMMNPIVLILLVFATGCISPREEHFSDRDTAMAEEWVIDKEANLSDMIRLGLREGYPIDAHYGEVLSSRFDVENFRGSDAELLVHLKARRAELEQHIDQLRNDLIKYRY